MSEPIWYHGGVPGLAAGELLIPPSATGMPTLGVQVAQLRAEGMAVDHVRHDRVFLTTDKSLAAFYATLYPYGAVYEAAPEGEAEPDPDCTEPGLSLQCERARIVRVVICGYPDLAKRKRAAMARADRKEQGGRNAPMRRIVSQRHS